MKIAIQLLVFLFLHLSSDGVGRPAARSPVWNFAYGANMNLGTLGRRRVVPLKSFPARLAHWGLYFNLIGIPWLEPAFGNVEPAANQTVHGVAHLFSSEDFEKLRDAEAGAGYAGEGYEVGEVDVVAYDGTPIKAKAFLAVPKWKHAARPSRRYLNLLIEGARQHHLDETYISARLMGQPADASTWLQKALVMTALTPIALPAWVAKTLCRFVGVSTLWFERLLLKVARTLWKINGE